MNCNSVKQKLIFYLDGDLAVDEANLVKCHLVNCGECRFYYTELKKSLSIIETDKSKEIDGKFYSKLSKRLDDIESTHETTSLKYKLVQVFAYAAVVAIGIFIGLFAENEINNISENKNTEFVEQTIVWNDFNQEPIESFLIAE